MLLPPSRLAGAATSRWFSTAFTAASAGFFKHCWKNVVPLFDPSITPLSFYHSPRQMPGSNPSKIAFNLFRLFSSEFLSNKEVDTITFPATTGQMGVLPGHTETMAELKPGVLSLHKGSKTTNYFVWGGFGSIDSDSIADIITVEIDRIVPNMVQKGIHKFAQKFASATTDYEKAEAQIGLDVHNALQSARR